MFRRESRPEPARLVAEAKASAGHDGGKNYKEENMIMRYANELVELNRMLFSR